MEASLDPQSVEGLAMGADCSPPPRPSQGPRTTGGRYHIVWITKYRYRVLEGALRERMRTIIRQVRKDLVVQIVSGALARELVHMLVEIRPHIAGSDFVRRVNGRSS